MCIDNPIPFHSDTPITAYKVMKAYADVIESLVAGNQYIMGSIYSAESPAHPELISSSTKYGKGFHAFEKLEDAKIYLEMARGLNNRGLDNYMTETLVEVEISEITYKGDEWGMNVYVSQRCRFIEAVKE